MSYIKQAEQKLFEMPASQVHEIADNMYLRKSASRLMAITRIIDHLLSIQNEPRFAEELSTIGVEFIPPYVEKSLVDITRRMQRDGLYFPIIVQSNILLKSPAGDKTVYSGRAKKISNSAELEVFLKNIVDKTIKYKHISNGYTFANITNYIQNEPKTKSAVVKVANSQVENCVINILREFRPDNIEKIYKKFPLLRPTDSDQKIYVNGEQIDTLARMMNLRIVTYSELGALLNIPWEKYGTGNKKQIKIKIAEEHATLIPEKLKVDKIVYHDVLDKNELFSTKIVDRAYKKTVESDLKYYTKVENGNLVVHKTFRPSSITNNPLDDEDIKTAYLFDTNQFLSRLFKTTYNLTPIQDVNIRSITKAAEHFIGRKVFEKLDPINKRYTEFDQNKNYISYEKSSFYKGFPSNTLSPSFQPCNPAFVVATLQNVPESFQKFYSYKDNEKIVLTMPMFEYLKSQGTNSEVEYYLNTDNFSHISIIDFADKQNISSNDKKYFRNQLIGRTITGGLSEAKMIDVYPVNEQEKQQIIYECETNNLPYQIRDKLMKIEIPNKTKGLFNFHAYILAFAGIHMMQKYKELTDKNRKIVGFCVDAIVTEGKFNENNTEIGGWTSDFPSDYYFAMEPKETVYVPPVLPELKIPIRHVPTRNTLFSGPAGIGKSYPWKADPAYKQKLLTPTHNLKDDHLKMFLNTHTAASYFQFNIDDDKYNLFKCLRVIPEDPAYLIIDEFTQFDKKQWETILKRKGSSILIALGDFEQISNEIENEAVTKQFFIDNKFDIQEIERTKLSIARHEFEYGVLLDTLRKKPVVKQAQIVKNGIWNKLTLDQITLTEHDHIIAGSHSAIYKYHQYFKNKLQFFPFKTIEKRPKIVILPTNTPNVFWDRQLMKDKPNANDIYEPCLAITADSYQGTTAEVNLFIDVNSLTRHGCLYTAMTRTRKAENTVIII